MYSTVLTFKDNISTSMLRVCESAFDNRAGKADCRRVSPAQIAFEGGDNLWACLQLGILGLDDVAGLKEQLSSWEWLDADPNENHDVMEALAIPVWSA